MKKQYRVKKSEEIEKIIKEKNYKSNPYITLYKKENTETAHRELLEETGVNSEFISPIGLFSKPDRDPRGWVVTQAYLCKVNFTECKALAGDDAKNAEWFDLTVKNQIITLDNGDCIISFKYENGKIEYISKDKLAFDHAEIIAKAIELL